jgi:hypothetical protein
MKLFDVNHTVLIVVGSAIPQEINDRPLAYRLAEAIDARGDAAAWKRAVVISDLSYESDAVAQSCPTVSIGGMAANVVSARFCRILPVALSVEGNSFIHLDITFRDQRVLLWGKGQDETARAVDLFVGKGFLERYLRHVWRT